MQVRDSAGVRIVENRRASWGADGGWRLDTVPLLTLGSAGLPGAAAGSGDGSAAEDALFERIVGVRRLADGRVAVLDAGAATLRIYDDGGREVERWGGYGEGPEEFLGPATLLGLPGDTLVVWDAPSTSVVRVVPGVGIVARTPLTRVEAVQLRMPSIAADGSILMPGFAWPAGSGEQDPGIYRGTAPVMVHAADGSRMDTLVLRPAREVMVAEIMGRSIVGDAPFAADLRAVWVGEAADPDASQPAVPLPTRAAIGDGSAIDDGGGWRWQVQIVDTAGALREVWRGPAGDLAVGDDDRSWYLDQLAAGASTPQERAMLPQMERALTWPDVRPAWTELRRDDTGHVWLRIGRHMALATPPAKWRIVSPDGVWLGDLELPPAFEPHHIGPEVIVGVRTDELGVERVEVYPLHR